VLKGEIAAQSLLFSRRYDQGDKVNTLLFNKKSPLPLTYFTSTIQVINKKSFQKE
jgi:hypothetical protein